MATITNTPKDYTLLRLERRKSFSLGIWLSDERGQTLDITGCSIRISVGGDELSNLILNDDAELVDPLVGYAQFNLQSADLDLEAKEYPYVITLIDDGGYSSVLVKGTLEVSDNPESESTSVDYDTTNPATTLQVRMRGRDTIKVYVSHFQGPGTTSYTLVEQEKLAQLHADAQLPPGGFPGNVLARVGAEDYATHWVVPTGGGGSGLDPTGIPAGYVPTSLGSDSWNWAALPPSGVTEVNGASGSVTLDLDDIPDTASRYSISAAEKTNVSELDTASKRPESYFRKTADKIVDADVDGVLSNTKVPKLMGLRGVQSGTAAPGVGWSGTPVAGDIYFQLEA